MPSAKRPTQLAVLTVCGALSVGSLVGCETTQEQAATKRAESQRILKARAKRQLRGTKSRNPSADGTNSRTQRDKSARRHFEHDKTARQGQEGKG